MKSAPLVKMAKITKGQYMNVNERAVYIYVHYPMQIAKFGLNQLSSNHKRAA